jgi:hypothetical protein
MKKATKKKLTVNDEESMPMVQDELGEAKPYTEEREFEVIAEVGQGIALPSDSKYRVMIKIGEHKLMTPDPVFTIGNYNRWLHRFP